MGYKIPHYNDAIRDCWMEARERLVNKATGHAETTAVRDLTREIFEERVRNEDDNPDYVEYEMFGAEIRRDHLKRALSHAVYKVYSNDTVHTRKMLCVALETVKDLDLSNMNQHHARHSIDQALQPVYRRIIKVPSPDYSQTWEKEVKDLSFTEVARAAAYRGKLISYDRNSMELIEFLARAGHILGADARQKVRRFFNAA